MGVFDGIIPQQIDLANSVWNLAKTQPLQNRTKTKIYGMAALFDREEKMAAFDADAANQESQKQTSEQGELYSPPCSPLGNPIWGEGDCVDLSIQTQSEGELLKQVLCVSSSSDLAKSTDTNLFMIIGLDTEYVEDSETLVSVQFCTHDKAVIFYISDLVREYRLELQTYLEIVFDLMDVPKNLKRNEENKVKPIELYIVAHFSTADLSQFGFRNYDPIRFIQKCGRGYASADYGWRIKPLILRDKYDHQKWSVRVNYRDTMSLVDGGSLKQLGEVIGVPKIELPSGVIERMDEFLEDDPKKFTEYALNDALITYEYASLLTIDSSVPTSAPALASRYLKQKLEENGIDVDTWRGMRPVELEGLNQSTGLNGGLNYLQVSGYEPLGYASRRIHEVFSQAYRGGLNQCYSHGYESDASYDLDLCNAYPTFMACVPDIDYTTPPTIQQRIELTPVILGDPWIPAGGCCDVELPESCMFPPVAVQVHVGTTCGLVAPLKLREVYITAPEAYAVLAMGGRVFAHEWITPAIAKNEKMADRYTMASVMASLVAERSRAKHLFGKGSISDKTMKLIANSMYGKIAQGLQESTAFDAALRISTPKPISTVTNVALAAMATAGPRAFLSLVMQMCHQNDHKVFSVTTDGFITTATADEAMRFMNENQMCKRWADYIEFVRINLTSLEEGGSNPVWMECKHENPEGFMNIATRMNVAPNVDGVCAHTGYKSKYMPKSKELRQEVIEKVVNRSGQVETFTSQASSLRDLVMTRLLPLKIEKSDKKISMDYDYKRKPVNPETNEFEAFDNSYSYLHFDTVPYESVEEYARFKHAAINRKQCAINTVSKVMSVEASATSDDGLKAEAKLQREHEKKLTPDQKIVYAIRAWSQGLVTFACGVRCHVETVIGNDGKPKQVKRYMKNETLINFLHERGFDVDETVIKNACRTDKKYLPPFELYSDVVEILK